MLWKKTAVALAGLLCIGIGVAAGDEDTVDIDIAADGARTVDVSLEFGAGKLDLTGADIERVVQGKLILDPEWYSHSSRYKVSGTRGRLSLSSEQEKRGQIDTDKNQWDLTLSTRYPLSLEMELGACAATLDFGGIPVEEFDMDVGAAACHLAFSEPNPVRPDQMNIQAGASSLKTEFLGNANFRDFNFEGGVGSFDLDFRGKYAGKSYVDIEVGLGSADITLPKDVALRIEADDDGWLSSVDFHGGELEEIDDGIYQTRDYDDAVDKLLVRVEVGLGSIDIQFK